MRNMLLVCFASTITILVPTFGQNATTRPVFEKRMQDGSRLQVVEAIVHLPRTKPTTSVEEVTWPDGGGTHKERVTTYLPVRRLIYSFRLRGPRDDEWHLLHRFETFASEVTPAGVDPTGKVFDATVDTGLLIAVYKARSDTYAVVVDADPVRAEAGGGEVLASSKVYTDSQAMARFAAGARLEPVAAGSPAGPTTHTLALDVDLLPDDKHLPNPLLFRLQKDDKGKYAWIAAHPDAGRAP